MSIIPILLIVTAAVGAVSIPLFRPRRSAAASVPAGRRYPDDASIDAAVARYRDARRAGTVCERCHFANPADSRFCADCGHGIRVV